MHSIWCLVLQDTINCSTQHEIWCSHGNKHSSHYCFLGQNAGHALWYTRSNVLEKLAVSFFRALLVPWSWRHPVPLLYCYVSTRRDSSRPMLKTRKYISHTNTTCPSPFSHYNNKTILQKLDHYSYKETLSYILQLQQPKINWGYNQ